MKSIISLALAAVMTVSLLSGCGRNRNEDVLPVATTTPAQTTAQANEPATADENVPGTNTTGNGGTTNAGNENTGNNAVNDMVNDVENGVNNAVNDVVDGIESIPGDVEDGRVEDEVAGVRNTPKAG